MYACMHVCVHAHVPVHVHVYIAAAKEPRATALAPLRALLATLCSRTSNFEIMAVRQPVYLLLRACYYAPLYYFCFCYATATCPVLVRS